MTDKRTFVSLLALAFALTLTSRDGAGADPALRHDGNHSKNLLIRPYLAPTGAVVPKPGEPQTGSQTAQEKRAQQRMKEITHSICSNC